MEPSEEDIKRIIHISKEDAAYRITMEISADKINRTKKLLEEPEEKEQFDKRLNRFMEHFPVRSKDGKDLDKVEVDQDLLILKGRLLIEELIREFIIKNFPNNEDIDEIHPLWDSARFTFSQCVIIARHLSFDKSFNYLWDAVEWLNKLRNKMAHNLEPKGFEDSLQEFMRQTWEAAPGGKPAALFEKFGELPILIFLIWNELSHLVTDKALHEFIFLE